MPTNICFGPDLRIMVEEDAAEVQQLLVKKGPDYVKLTALHELHESVSGDVWVNPAQVRFLNGMG
jgi:hypothetical protein